MKEKTPFTIQVIQIIEKIPRGKVATYRQIAELAGQPQAARGVSWILHSCSTKYKLPWQRVINSKGQISFERASHNFRKQMKLLRQEEVEVSSEGQVDLKEYQWKKSVRKKTRANTPNIFKN